MATATQLTEQFYAWERRGRGGVVATHPVDLEPPFHPFFGHFIRTPYTDDGKRPTMLSKIADLFRPAPKLAEGEQLYEPSYKPFPFTCDDALERLSILIAKHHVPTPSDAEQLLAVLSYCQYPVSFEIVADAEKIELQVVCRQSETLFIQQQLRTYVRECFIMNTTDKGENLLSYDDRQTSLIDFGLAEEFMRPIAMEAKGGECLMNFLTGCNYLKGDERVALQVLFNGTVNTWEESIMTAVSDRTGASFFYDAPEMPMLAVQKNSAPLFAVSIRVLAQGREALLSRSLVQFAAMAIKHGTQSHHNALVPLQLPDYSFDTMLSDMLNRQSHRTGMLLNAKELASLVHVPKAMWSKKFEHSDTKTKELPAIAIGHDYVLGMNEHYGSNWEASLSPEQRLKHLHIIGATGTGKSTLLLNLIKQDMEQGNGIAVLDAHGDLIETILAHVPRHRMKDVVLIDPSDSDHPIPFNLLKAHTAIEKEILSSDLVASFRRLSSSWGDQMNSVLANAILAFLNSSQGGTLMELRRFLIEKPFREAYLKTIQDEHILYYWQHEYPLLKSSSIGSILTRLDIFLRPTLIRNMVAQKDCIDMAALMDGKKIVLVKLSHGIIGAENSYLLGTSIVSKMQQIAMSRQVQAKDERSDFFIYIDEFQHFITPSMNTILSGARKYRVGLILAHQSMQQLQKQDSELAGEVIANAGTRICFRLGEYDARLFNGSFSSFTGDDLQRLDTGTAVARIERADNDFSLNTIQIDELIQDADGIASIIAYSRSTHAIEIQHQPVEPIIPVVPDIPKPQPVQKEKIPVEQPQAPKSPVGDGNTTLEAFAKRKEMQQHRSLQHAIKQLGEAKGYVATIEAPIHNGTGKVDVLLSKGDKRIACEVSVSTDATWESHNIKKCLEANYDEVWCIVSNANTKASLEGYMKTLEQTQIQKITIVERVHMQSLFERLKAEEAKPQEQVIKGYRVKVEFGDSSSDDMKEKQQSLQNILRGRKKK